MRGDREQRRHLRLRDDIAPIAVAGTPGDAMYASFPGWLEANAPEELIGVDAERASYGDVPGTHAHQLRLADAEPDVVVKAPEGRYHHNLWDIAEEHLGDGRRWKEIFELNKGKPQPDGRPFTQPSLIFPGEELALPSEAPVQPTPPQLPPTTPTPPTTPPPSLAPASPDLTGTNTAPRAWARRHATASAASPPGSAAAIARGAHHVTAVVPR